MTTATARPTRWPPWWWWAVILTAVLVVAGLGDTWLTWAGLAAVFAVAALKPR